MKFLEKDLEEIIYNTAKDKLSEKGLTIMGKLKRQVKIGNYGIADLIEIERPFYHTHFKKHVKGKITVYELKKDEMSVSAFFQAVRYVKGIQRWIYKKTNFDYSDFDYEIVIIGRNDKNSDVVYLSDIFSNYGDESFVGSDLGKCSVRLVEYSFDVDGLQFEELNGFKLIEEGF